MEQSDKIRIGHRFELLGWLLQACAIGYELCGSLITTRVSRSTIILLAMFIPTVILIVRTWSVSVKKERYRYGALIRLVFFVYQVTLLCIVLRSHAPGVVNSDSPLVLIGLPYFWVGVVRRGTDRPPNEKVAGKAPTLEAAMYFVLSAFVAVWVARHWPTGESERDAVLVLRSLEASIVALIVAVVGRKAFRRLRNHESGVAAGLARRTAVVAWARHDGYVAILQRIAARSGATLVPEAAAGCTLDPEASEVGLLLRKLRRRRGALGTEVDYGNTTFAWTLLLDPKDAAPLIQFIRGVAERESSSLRVDVRPGEHEVDISFTAAFSLQLWAPEGFRRSHIADGSVVYSCQLPCLVVPPVDGVQGNGAHVSCSIRQHTVFGIYGSLILGITLLQAIDVPASLIELNGSGHSLNGLHFGGALVFLTLIGLRWRLSAFHRGRLVDSRSAGWWVLLTGAALILGAGLLGSGGYFDTSGGPQIFARQLLAVIAVWVLPVPTRKAVVRAVVAGVGVFL